MVKIAEMISFGIIKIIKRHYHMSVLKILGSHTGRWRDPGIRYKDCRISIYSKISADTINAWWLNYSKSFSFWKNVVSDSSTFSSYASLSFFRSGTCRIILQEVLDNISYGVSGSSSIPHFFCTLHEWQ